MSYCHNSIWDPHGSSLERCWFSHNSQSNHLTQCCSHEDKMEAWRIMHAALRPHWEKWGINQKLWRKSWGWEDPSCLEGALLVPTILPLHQFKDFLYAEGRGIGGQGWRHPSPKFCFSKLLGGGESTKRFSEILWESSEKLVSFWCKESLHITKYFVQWVMLWHFK